MNPKVVAWLGSAIAAAVTGIGVAYLGGPAWAAYGIGFLAFAIYRSDDRMAGKR